MKLLYFFAFISLVLESALSIYLKSPFLPLFSLTSLVILYPFFNNKDQKFIVFASLYGLFYDIVMTDTLLLNFLAFLIIGIFIVYINQFLTNNFLLVMLITSLVIIAYRMIILLILFLIGYSPFNMSLLTSSITSSLLANVIYAFMFYLIFDFISRKYHINKID